MPLYFAYGANMDRDAMALRCPRSRPLGTARLPRHRFIITREGYASVVRDPRLTVHGVIWDLAMSEVRALDKFEAVDRGLYTKITQAVITEAGPRRALVYVGVNAEPGSPKPGYLEAVLASAESWNLPVAYQQEIARYMRAGASQKLAVPSPQAVTSDAARHRAGPVPGVQTRGETPAPTVGAVRRRPPG
jgi:gamma-glutamylcyclotransferase (GGCT)/AIG2-like uncharacterized protein YtfP